MGLSETILAAMIGAIATVTTALFQLFTVFRARNKVDSRPKKGTTMRSVLAVLALMVASAAGGFLYSELLKQRNGDDMRAMRQELKDLRALIADGRDAARVAATADLAAAREAEVSGAAVIPAAMAAVENSVESVVYVPACRRHDVAAACSEGDAQRVALCGTIPAYARVKAIELFVQPDAVQHSWDRHRAAFEQDLDGARFTGKTFEYAQADALKAVCVSFMHWSSEHPHIARIVVQYGFGTTPAGEAPANAQQPEMPMQTPAVITAETLPAIPTTASFTTPAHNPQ
jgi:hypothetical protein